MLRPAALFTLGAALALAACSSRTGSPASTKDDPHDSGIRVRAADLSGSGTLLDALRHRVRTMDVTFPSDSPCPRILLRGRRFADNRREDPTVYVDGTRMTGTCVLTQVTTDEVDSVVVYHAGTSPSSFPSSGFGLILVYRGRR